MWHGNSSHAAVFDNNKDLIDFSKARVFGFEMASLLKDPVAFGLVLTYYFTGLVYLLMALHLLSSLMRYGH